MGVNVKAKLDWDGLAPIDLNVDELRLLVQSLLSVDPRRFEFKVDGALIPEAFIETLAKLAEEIRQEDVDGFGSGGEPITYGDLVVLETALLVAPTDDALQALRVRIQECLRSHRRDHYIARLVEREMN